MNISGIGAVKNIENEKIFAFKSFNLEKQWKIYQNQLNLNIHHNKRLQKDWNKFGSDNFEFLIIDEIEDDFYLDDEFVDYVSRLDNSYNEFNISSFVFEYLEASSFLILYDLIGKYECSHEFADKLKRNDLSEDNYDEIKNEMISFIESDYINDDEIENTLNELIKEKSHQIRIFNLDMQYQLMNELEDIIGIAELNKEFVSKLNENGLTEVVGFTIQEKIMEMIFSNNVVDNDIEKQIDSCIEILKERVSQEIKEKLLEKADNLENDEEFINKLNESRLPLTAAPKIISQFKELILSGIISEDEFSQKLDELIEIEIENQWLETKQELFDYLAETLDSEDIINKLDSYYIDHQILTEIDKSVKEAIENKEITSKDDIDEAIDGYIDEEILRINNLKEELLVYLDNEYGLDDLTPSFETRLTEVQLSIDDGKELISSLSQDISSFKISSTDEINMQLDELILDKNKSILYNQFDSLMGKDKNNDSFSKRLKLNYLTEEDGNKIRNDLLKLIPEDNGLEEIIILRNSLEFKLDEIIEEKSQVNYNKLVILSNELIQSLYECIGKEQINSSFKRNLYSNNLGEEYWELVKSEISELIQKVDEEFDYESKMNQLEDLKINGMDVLVDEIVQREAKIRIEEYNLLKTQLISELNELIGSKENSKYFDDLLIENNLSNHASTNIRKEFNVRIISDEVYDKDNFNYKYEELLSIKNKSIKELLFDLIQKQKNIYNKQLMDVRLYLLEELYQIIGKYSVIESFRNRLYSNQLSLDYAETFKKTMEDFINSDNVFNKQFVFKLDELMDLKENGVESKLNDLIDEESQIKINELNALKKDLTSDLNNLTNDVKFKEKLKSNNLSTEIGNKIKNEADALINSAEVCDDKFNYKLEELINLSKKTVKFKFDELIKKYSSQYDKELKSVRNRLFGYVESIIGKNKIKKSFKEILHENYLHETFASEIISQMYNFIDTDEVFDKNYEFKLNELKEYSLDDIESRIYDIIKHQRSLNEAELNNLRKILNNDLVNLIGVENNDYYNNLLISNNLNSKTGVLIRNQLSNLINSDEIEEDIYEFKLDELLVLKDMGLDKKLNQIIDIKSKEYDDNLEKTRNILIDDLNKICQSHSFENKLYLNALHDNYKDDFKKELTEFICSNQPYDDKFEVKLDELINLKDKSVELKLNELIEREHQIKIKELNDLRIELNDSLNELIGKDENNEYYTNLLKSSTLNSETGNRIRLKINDLINSESIMDSSNKFKLDELLALKEKGLNEHLNELIVKEEKKYKKNLKLVREKLLYSLKSIISNESFKENLYSKQIDDSFIGVINEKLTKKINSDVPCDNHFEVKLDELLSLDQKGIKAEINILIKTEEELRRKELEELKLELEKKLYSIIGKDKNSMLFNYKLINNNLNNSVKNRIREELIELVSSDTCQDSRFKYKLAELKDLKEQGVENRVDEIVEREAEIYNNELEEIRRILIDSVNSIIGKNQINPSFKHKLKSCGLEENFAGKIKQQLFDFINDENVSNKEFQVKLDELKDLKNRGVNAKIDEFIDKEIEKQTLILKEKLLKELYSITGDVPLTAEFMEKLDNANFDEKFGIEIIKHFESEIDSLNITEDCDFEKAIDEMIYDENRNILLNQTYEIIGRKSDSEYFTNKLKNNMILKESADEIRKELLSMIEDADLENLVHLREITMQAKFDKIISREHILRVNKLKDLRRKLLSSLNDRMNQVSFRNTLHSKNLSDDYIDKIKKEVEDFINSDDVRDEYEFKVDELNSLYHSGINSEIDDIVARESSKIEIEFDALKTSLLNELNQHILPSSSPSTFANIELNKRKLSRKTGKAAYDELNSLISYNKIVNRKFTTKFDELQDLENATLKKRFIELIEEYSKKQNELVAFLYSQTIKSSKFNRKLKKMNLHDDFVESLVDDIESKIMDNEFTTEAQITQKITQYVEQEAVEQNKALNKLYDKVGRKGISLKFRAYLIIKGVSVDDGKKIVQIVEEKIKTGRIKSDEVDEEIDRQIKALPDGKTGGNPLPPKPPRPKHIFCTQCGHKNLYEGNFCEQCGERLIK